MLNTEMDLQDLSFPQNYTSDGSIQLSASTVKQYSRNGQLVSLPLSLFISLSLSHCLSLSLPLSPSLSHCLSLSLSLSPSHCLSLSLSFSLAHIHKCAHVTSLSLSLSLTLSLSAILDWSSKGNDVSGHSLSHHAFSRDFEALTEFPSSLASYCFIITV